jgi:hypothetical protein
LLEALEAKGRHIGRPTAWPDDKIDYARLLRDQGNSLGENHQQDRNPKDIAAPLPDASNRTRVMSAATKPITASCAW